MEQDRIKERLLKMYRLAIDGVDGEKETAQKMLEEYVFETTRQVRNELR